MLRTDYDALKAEGALPASTGSVFRSDTSQSNRQPFVLVPASRNPNPVPKADL